jgi:hypothetical protein
MNAVTVISQALKAVYRDFPIGIDTGLIGMINKALNDRTRAFDKKVCLRSRLTPHPVA